MICSLITMMRQHIGIRYNTYLALWCDNNSLVLNIKKTKDNIVDFRKTGQYKHSPLSICSEVVERVTEFTFLRLTVSEDLSWSTNTASVVGKAQQRLYYLRKLKSSVLSYGFLVWFSSCTKADQQALQRVVKTAEGSSEILFRRWAPSSRLAV